MLITALKAKTKEFQDDPSIASFHARVWAMPSPAIKHAWEVPQITLEAWPEGVELARFGPVLTQRGEFKAYRSFDTLVKEMMGIFGFSVDFRLDPGV